MKDSLGDLEPFQKIMYVMVALVNLKEVVEWRPPFSFRNLIQNGRPEPRTIEASPIQQLVNH